MAYDSVYKIFYVVYKNTPGGSYPLYVDENLESTKAFFTYEAEEYLLKNKSSINNGEDVKIILGSVFTRSLSGGFCISFEKDKLFLELLDNYSGDVFPDSNNNDLNLFSDFEPFFSSYKRIPINRDFNILYYACPNDIKDLKSALSDDASMVSATEAELKDYIEEFVEENLLKERSDLFCR